MECVLYEALGKITGENESSSRAERKGERLKAPVPGVRNREIDGIETTAVEMSLVAVFRSAVIHAPSRLPASVRLSPDIRSHLPGAPLCCQSLQKREIVIIVAAEAEGILVVAECGGDINRFQEHRQEENDDYEERALLHFQISKPKLRVSPQRKMKLSFHVDV